MAVRIVMAKDGQSKSNPSVANRVKVFTDDNREITNITAIDVRFRPDEIVTATISVVVSAETKLEDLEPLIDKCTLEELAESRGMKLVPIIEEERSLWILDK